MPNPTPFFPLSNYDVIAIGASLGGIAALQTILARLPADFPAPILVAQHRSPRLPSFLREVLARKTPLTVKELEATAYLEAGTVYLARPGKHLRVNSGGVVEASVMLNVRFNPSIDVLFNSVAASSGQRALGVVLTGMLNDGAEGAAAIKAAGGCVLGQDRFTSECFDMPKAAIQRNGVNFLLPTEKITDALITLVMVQGIATLFQGSMPQASLLGN